MLDTNVLMSGIFFSGPPAQILEAWNQGDLDLVLSPEILEEYRRVAAELQRKYQSINVQPVLDRILVRSQICMTRPLATQVCTDADDDKFLACALAAEVQIIISGDKGLLKASGYNGLEVIRPRAFADNYL